MSVHYKFKSALDFDTISFDGLHISVADLKREITSKKKLGKTQDFDLQITNAQTKEEYSDDLCLIPKNTSLIIARVPLTLRQTKKSWDQPADKNTTSARTNKTSDTQAGNIDLTQMNGTEEEKINAMMKQSTMDYDPRNYQKVRGGTQTGDVPSSYRCYKCHKMGHWIKNCPLNIHHEHAEVKRNTGIPRSFIDAAAAGNALAVAEPIVLPPAETKQEIPDHLICSICKDLFTDAVMISCCGRSFCDECIRTALLESEDNECPDCNEKGSSPGSLIPSRFLRNSVNSFKNETGYNKPRPKKEIPAVLEESTQPEEESNDATTPDRTILSSSHESSNERPEEEKANVNQDTKQPENIDNPNECDTPLTDAHDESDYEDNITVTVPKPQSQSTQVLGGSNYYRDRSHLNGRYNRPLSVPEIGDNMSASQQQQQQQQPSQMNVNPRYGLIPPQTTQHGHQVLPPQLGHHHRSIPSNHFQSNQGPMSMQSYDAYAMQQGKKPIGASSFYPNNYYQNQAGFYPKADMQRHGMDIRGSYNAMPPLHSQNSHMMGHQPPQMHHKLRPPMLQQSNAVATAYQGVADKIGTGIIEDPLAAFEQIMKEKERRKKERRTNVPSPRRRSRSIDRRRSPTDRRSPRNISADRDRVRSTDFRATDLKERSTSRGRERVRADRSGRSNERRRRRSGSYHSRQSWDGRSYSRSRSNSPRRHSRTPHRKYSRSPQHRRSRSRSGSHSRSRHRDGRDLGRRDYREREEYRDRSPNNYASGRGRGLYRNRGRGNYYRHPAPHQQLPMAQHSHSTMPYYDPSVNLINTRGGPYRDSSYQDIQHNRYDMMPTSSIVIPPSSDFAPQTGHAVQEIHPVDPNDPITNRNISGSASQQYDVLPPGVESPPPPGCENEAKLAHPKRYNRESEWNAEHKVDKETTAEYRQQRRQDQSPQRSFADKESRSPSKLKADKSDKFNRKSPSERDKIRDSARKEQYREKEKETDKDKEVDKEKEKEKEKEKDRRRVSTDDDKHERRSKDKRKKKKDDKTLEKKKKKEKKQREKENKKEQHRGKKMSKVHVATSNNDKPGTLGEHESTSSYQAKSEPIQGDACFLLMSPIQQHDKSATALVVQNNDDSINLYSDVNMEMENEAEMIYPSNDFGITSSPSKLNRSDSVLDIHANVDFEEADIQESDTEEQTTAQQANEMIFTPMPEPSKWEREDDTGHDKTMLDQSPTDDQLKVTNEVLKRAENAIFTRAINAIRPVENKRNTQDRQKLCTSDPKRIDDDKSAPVTITAASVDNSASADNSLQITLNNAEQERSVEIWSGVRPQKQKTPLRSIRERLGKKIGDRVESPSGTPEREVINQSERTRSQSKEKNRPIEKYKTKSSTEKKMHNSRDRYRSLDGQNKEKNDRGTKDRKNKPGDNSRSSSTNRDKHDHNREKTRSIDNNKSHRVLTLNRDTHRRQAESSTRFRDRELEKARELARIRERNRSQQKSSKAKSIASSSKDPKDAHNTRQNDRSNNATDNRSTKRNIDESNFEPDYEDQPVDENEDSRFKKKHTNHTNVKRLNRKRSRSNSESSTSSSNSNSSCSDEEDRKRKKKRKHKKQKKSKRSTPDALSSSSDSDENKKKSKKRSKKSKKKKKTKK